MLGIDALHRLAETLLGVGHGVDMQRHRLAAGDHFVAQPLRHESGVAGDGREQRPALLPAEGAERDAQQLAAEAHGPGIGYGDLARITDIGRLSAGARPIHILQAELRQRAAIGEAVARIDLAGVALLIGDRQIGAGEGGEDVVVLGPRIWGPLSLDFADVRGTASAGYRGSYPGGRLKVSWRGSLPEGRRDVDFFEASPNVRSRFLDPMPHRRI